MIADDAYEIKGEIRKGREEVKGVDMYESVVWWKRDMESKGEISKNWVDIVWCQLLFSKERMSWICCWT